MVLYVCKKVKSIHIRGTMPPERRTQILSIMLVAGLLVGFGTVPCLGQMDQSQYEEIVRSVNTIWVLLAAFLVFFMQAGFGMVEAGFTRAKNAANILMKNFLDFCIASIGFWAFGFAIMFGAGNAIFGTEGFFLSEMAADIAGIPAPAFWFFQAVFCGAAATIVAGAMAERMRFPAYLAYSFVISAFVYPLVGHWVWGGGWLQELGFLDFAGSTVVHAVGGWAGLMGTLVLGPRIGKFGRDGTPNIIMGHNIPLAALGVFILWFGWFGFNPGSTLSGMASSLIAKVAVNTNLAAATGALTAMVLVWHRYGKPDLGMTMNGALGGLVAVTAPCAFVSTASAGAIGIISGLVTVFGVRLLDRVGIDDPVGAVPVHGLNGVWGTLSIGLFHGSEGLIFGGGVGQLGIQALGILTVVVFVSIAMFSVFKIIDRVIGLRVSRDEEIRGLDLGEHGLESYSGFQIFVAE
jgi:Amt family ammonium transporter